MLTQMLIIDKKNFSTIIMYFDDSLPVLEVGLLPTLDPYSAQCMRNSRKVRRQSP